MHKKDITETVTLIETPPMVVVGLVGYIDTPFGKKMEEQYGLNIYQRHVKEDFTKIGMIQKRKLLQNTQDYITEKIKDKTEKNFLKK